MEIKDIITILNSTNNSNPNQNILTNLLPLIMNMQNRSSLNNSQNYEKEINNNISKLFN